MRCVLLLFFGLLMPFQLLAQSRIYVNEYLNIGVGARSLGMAGATSASVENVYAGYWNPAGLIGVSTDVDVGLMHAEYFAGIFKYDYAAAALPLKSKNATLAVSFLRFATDNIPYTIDYVQPDGSFDDSKLRGFSAGDYAAIFSYAQKLPVLKSHPKWTVRAGANAKIIYRHVGQMANAWGFGLDLGLQAAYKQWRFGMMMKDITTTYTAWSFHLSDREKQVFAVTGNEIPIKSYELMMPRFNLGVARYILPAGKKFQVLAEFGMDVTTDGKRATLIAGNTISIDPRFGIEASYKNALFLRAGVGNFNRVLDNTDTLNREKYTVFQPSVGVGFKVKNLSVDYAFTSLQMQDNPLMSHIISLHIGFNRTRKKEQPERIDPSLPVPQSEVSRPSTDDDATSKPDHDPTKP